MKLKPWNIILSLLLFLSCKIERNLNGNYSMCNNGEYSEVYFKKDSMRVASDSKWVKLTKWRKFEINNDTLYFTSFGEFKENWKAKINYVGFNKIELHNLLTDKKFELEPINRNLNFENLNRFWTGFNKRQKSNHCN